MPRKEAARLGLQVREVGGAEGPEMTAPGGERGFQKGPKQGVARLVRCQGAVYLTAIPVFGPTEVVGLCLSLLLCSNTKHELGLQLKSDKSFVFWEKKKTDLLSHIACIYFHCSVEMYLITLILIKTCGGFWVRAVAE